MHLLNCAAVLNGRPFSFRGGIMGGRVNVRLINRKAYEEQRRAIYRRVQAGEPCAICGRPIDLTAPRWILKDGRRVLSPWSLEVDHVQPIAAGGSIDSIDNVQPAHRACNERKGRGRAGSSFVSSCAPRAGSVSRNW